MTQRPHFPPIYRPYAITADLDPFERAVEMAAEGTEAGTLLWSSRQDVYECAIVLAPENSLETSLPVILTASLGLGDALGALIPPVIAVTFGWPDRIEVNGGIVGKIRLIIAETPNPTVIPDWLVIGFNLA
ncbi:MAG: biotin/lipoate--protein ligase family protein, partial [Geminicoccaceae bacterium]